MIKDHNCPVLLTVYVDGFHSPDTISFPSVEECQGVEEALVNGEFTRVEGLMENGQRFTMRRKVKNETKGREAISFRLADSRLDFEHYF